MNWTRTRVVVLTVIVSAVIGGTLWQYEAEEHDALRRMVSRAREVSLLYQGTSSDAFAPLPVKEPAIDGDKAALGQRLFHDTRLSGDRSLSCASCHDVSAGGEDGRPRSVGVLGNEVTLNAPSVLNSSYNLLHFWFGRAEGMAAHDDRSVHGPAEMGSSFELAAYRLSRDPATSEVFDSLYREGPTAETLKDALASYLATLSTPQSRFDRFLRGERDALSLYERQGYRLFRSIGCAACHQGRNIGGNMVQRFGVFEDYLAERGEITEADYGRFNLTGHEEDRFFFRVPSLRNVTRTAPYFHDGSAANLESAVAIMARIQLGKRLSDDETSKLVAFLGTLDGTAPEAGQ